MDTLQPFHLGTEEVVHGLCEEQEEVGSERTALSDGALEAETIPIRPLMMTLL